MYVCVHVSVFRFVCVCVCALVCECVCECVWIVAKMREADKGAKKRTKNHEEADAETRTV